MWADVTPWLSFRRQMAANLTSGECPGGWPGGIMPHGVRPRDLLYDGTPFLAPFGRLDHSTESDRVVCHLNGRWFKALAPVHLLRAHGWDAVDYKAAFGLSKGTPSSCKCSCHAPRQPQGPGRTGQGPGADAVWRYGRCTSRWSRSWRASYVLVWRPSTDGRQKPMSTGAGAASGVSRI